MMSQPLRCLDIQRCLRHGPDGIHLQRDEINKDVRHPGERSAEPTGAAVAGTRDYTYGVLFRTAAILGLAVFVAPAWAQQPSAQTALLNKYCVTCHSEKLRTGGLSLQGADLTDVPKGAETWEKVIRKLRVGAMPPQGMPRPDKTTLDGLARFLKRRSTAAMPPSLTPGTRPCIA